MKEPTTELQDEELIQRLLALDKENLPQATKDQIVRQLIMDYGQDRVLEIGAELARRKELAKLGGLPDESN